MQRFLIFSLLFLTAPARSEPSSHPIYSQHSTLTVEKLNNATETLRDPTVIPRKFAQALNNLSAPTRNGSKTTSGRGSIQDPTQINGSFSAALKRLSERNRGGTASDLKLPKITLAAKTLKRGGQQASALLEINKEMYFVKPGESLSFMQDNRIYEIEVENIDSHAVRIKLYPIDETLILR